jgi:hypothetical protein
VPAGVTRPSDSGTSLCGHASANTCQPSLLLLLLLALVEVLLLLLLLLLELLLPELPCAVDRPSCQMTSGMPSSTKRCGAEASKSLRCGMDACM